MIHDPMVGNKYWSLVNHSISMPYTRKHQRIIMYGSITKDGRQFFRACEKFNADTFVSYLKKLKRKCGKVAVILDRAPQHRAKVVRKFF